MYTTSTESTLRLTVAALMYATGEDQSALAAGIGLSQPMISRKQAGKSGWLLPDLDKLAAHYNIPVPDLLAGVDHAVSRLPARRRAAVVGGVQTTVPTQ